VNQDLWFATHDARTVAREARRRPKSVVGSGAGRGLRLGCWWALGVKVAAWRLALLDFGCVFIFWFPFEVNAKGGRIQLYAWADLVQNQY